MSSPTQHTHETHFYAPQTARVKALVFDAGWSYRQVDRHTSKHGARIPKSTAWDLAHGSSSRRITNDSNRLETRGSKKKLSREDVARADNLLLQAGFEEKNLS